MVIREEMLLLHAQTVKPIHVTMYWTLDYSVFIISYTYVLLNILTYFYKRFGSEDEKFGNEDEGTEELEEIDENEEKGE